MQTNIKTIEKLVPVLETVVTKVKNCRLPLDISKFRNEYSFKSGIFTFSSEKVMKNETVSKAPTAVLYMFPTAAACVGAGSCRDLCLNTAGVPMYLKNKIACRLRRDKAFREQTNIFVRNLVIESLKFYRKNASWDRCGLRLNGTSDFPWFAIPCTITQEDSDYCMKAFNIRIEAKRHKSVLEAILFSHDNYLEQLVKEKCKAYDYTKNVLFEQYLDYIDYLDYHLSLSHGSKFDTFSLSKKLGKNYLAAVQATRKSDLPKFIKYNGEIFETFDADTTDFRYDDKSDKMRIGLLRIKRTPNQTQEKLDKFCIKYETVKPEQVWQAVK